MNFQQELVNYFEKKISFSHEQLINVSKQMLINIGIEDPQIRDGLIYEAFYDFINKGLFTNDDLRWLINVAMDNNHICYDLHTKKKSNSVLTRSFSSLLLATILAYNTSNHFLSNNEVINIANTFLDYYEQEWDLRGFNEELGWIHAVAHGADVLAEIMKVISKDESLIRRILNSIHDKINQGSVYTHGEIRRLINALIAYINSSNYEEIVLSNWLRNFSINDTEFSMNYFYRVINHESFFHYFYFAIKDDQKFSRIAEQVDLLLKELRK